MKLLEMMALFIGVGILIFMYIIGTLVGCRVINHLWNVIWLPLE